MSTLVSFAEKRNEISRENEPHFQKSAPRHANEISGFRKKKFALQSSHLAICDMLVRQKLIKRFLAYCKYETQIARQKVVRELPKSCAIRYRIFPWLAHFSCTAF